MLSRRLTSSGLLLVFLAGLMCVCGLLGYRHAPVLESGASSEAHPAVTQSGFADGVPQDYGRSAAYTAALFAVTLGAALGLLFRVARRRSGARAVLAAGRIPPPVVLPPPRIPTRSRLQVFLL